MAEFARISITKLNNQNYAVWKYKLELLLLKEGLWDTVIDNPPNPITDDWKRKDGKARATIGLHVEDNQLIHIKRQKTAKEIWLTLQKYHEKSTLSLKVSLMRQLFRTQLQEGGNVEKHLDSISDILDRLITIGEEIKDDFVVAVVLSSLPESYNTFITALETRPTKDLTLDLVKTKLMEEYERRKKGYDEVNSEGEGAAMKMQHGKFGQKKRYINEPQQRNEEKNGCYHCGILGHYKRDCRKLKAKRRETIHHVKATIQNKQFNDSESDSSSNGDSDQEVCFHVRNNLNAKAWYVDSGASSHMCGDKDLFTNICAPIVKKVALANGQSINVEGMGNIYVYCKKADHNYTKILVTNVLYVPGLIGNLLSVKAMVKRGLKVDFKKGSCKIKKGNTILAMAILKNNLYELQIKNSEVANISTHEEAHSCIHLWHKRFGHRDINTVKTLSNGNLVKGVTFANCNATEVCEPCVRAKMVRKSFPKNDPVKITTKIFDVIHSDVCGPMQVISPSGHRYFITFIDDNSRFTTVYFLKTKNEASQRVKHFVNYIQTRFGRTIKALRTDRGGEYVNADLRHFLDEKGIVHQMTCPYSPQQNGTAERKNRSLVEMGRCMLFGAGLNHRFWAEAISHAAYLQNRLPCRSIDSCPITRWFRKTPELSNIRVFGSKVYMLRPEPGSQKWDDKTKILTLVGLEEGSKGYRLLDVDNNRIYISRDVKIDENYNCDTSKIVSSDIADDNFKVEVPIGTEDIAEDAEKMGATIRVSTRSTKGKPPDRLVETGYAALIFEEEPRSYSEAINGSEKIFWKKAMEDEYRSLMENGTWDLISPPKGEHVVGCKWVYKRKCNEDGTISQYKARLVAQGFSQRFGVNYDEVFAPVAKQTTLRILLSIAKAKSMSIKHYDVKTAFLNGNLSERVLMRQPEGFMQGEDNAVCLLRKSIYGLKQSARVWNECIHTKLLRNGFSQSAADACLYIKHVDDKWIYFLIYVDDFITADVDGLAYQTIIYLRKFFEVKDLGDLKYFLGLQFETDSNGNFYVHQSKYINEVIRRFGLDQAHEKSTPMRTDYIRDMYDGEILPSTGQYQRAIGSLLYIAVNSRPDVCTSVVVLSRKNNSPTQNDWDAVKQVICYLKKTSGYRLRLFSRINDENPDVCIIGYVDANWAEDTSDRKSNSGFVFMVNECVISWKVVKQATVSLSSTEAEYNALVDASKEAIWIKSVIDDLKGIVVLPITVYEDNQSCLHFIKNQRRNSRTKHIDVKHHFLKERSDSGELSFKFCCSKRMMADCMTKPVCRAKLEEFVKWVGLKQ